MYVFIIVAAFYTGLSDNPFLAITRPSIPYYQTEELCKADLDKQVKAFTSGLPSKPDLFFGKCVKITGPNGDPA